jgi:hypothetical protein
LLTVVDGLVRRCLRHHSAHINELPDLVVLEEERVLLVILSVALENGNQLGVEVGDPVAVAVEDREAHAAVLASTESSGLDDALATVQDVELLGSWVGGDVGVD